MPATSKAYLGPRSNGSSFDINESIAAISHQAMRRTQIEFLLGRFAAETDFGDSWTGGSNNIAAADSMYRTKQTFQRLRPFLEELLESEDAVSRKLLEQVQILTRKHDILSSRPHRGFVAMLVLVIAALLAFCLLRILKRPQNTHGSQRHEMAEEQAPTTPLSDREDDDYDFFCPSSSHSES